MSNLKTNSILGAIALGKRAAGDPKKPIAVPEVKITDTKLVKGDPTYDFGGKKVTHSSILAAVPQAQRASVDKYLTTFRIKRGGTETPVSKGTSAMSDHYVIQGGGTKNDTYDMISAIAKNMK